MHRLPMWQAVHSCFDALTDYAITGIPIMREGEDVSFERFVKPQGWDGSELYGTWHVFVGLKNTAAKTLFVMGMRTRTGNMVLSAEAFNQFKTMGFRDVIKLDGGGSFYFNASGQSSATLGNRRVCTVIHFGNAENPYPYPTATLRKWGTNREGNRWLQWELTAHGYSCDVDGVFGPDTEKQLRAFQKAERLVVDGICGPATRNVLAG